MGVWNPDSRCGGVHRATGDARECSLCPLLGNVFCCESIKKRSSGSLTPRPPPPPRPTAPPSPPRPIVSSALFAPRIFAARPGQKSPTALHDESSEDKDEGINYTTVDWREFMCNTWHLEPTLRSAAGAPPKQLEGGGYYFRCYFNIQASKLC